jgi:hypothetical protein
LSGPVALGFRREGRLAGFGVAHQAVEGFNVGPLFAAELAAAEFLLRGLTAEAGDGSFELDTPACVCRTLTPLKWSIDSR